MTGIIGGIIATLLIGWLASRAQKDAEAISGRRVIEYGRAAKIAGWSFALFGIFVLYAAAHASKDQTVIAGFVGGGLFAICMILLAEFLFVRVEFDEYSIYTFSPWRKQRIIPWGDVVGYGYSDINQWHILKTAHSGSVRLSVLLSGLGTVIDELKKRKIHG